MENGLSTHVELPFIKNNDILSTLIAKISLYVQQIVVTSASFDELRKPTNSTRLLDLVSHLANNVRNKQVVPALLALRSYFANQSDDDEPGVNLTRAYACEFIAWRYVLLLSEWEVIDCLLDDLDLDLASSPGNEAPDVDEETQLLSPERLSDHLEATPRSSRREDRSDRPRHRPVSLRFSNVSELLQAADVGPGKIVAHENDAFAMYFNHLNALEIAAVSGSKKFLSQRVIQNVIERIWKGDIVFWESMSVNSVKEAKVYNKRKADPFCRLRVPRYLKSFEAVFFLTFLGLYYAVLVPVQRSGRRPARLYNTDSNSKHLSLHANDASSSFHSVTGPEVLLYIWIAGFAYDEFGEFLDAGQAFYATDFWSLWDLGIVAIGAAFFICRLIGLAKHSDDIIGVAFDILSLEALFLVPRVCSLLSLNSYFGTLIPCLREMTKDFIKFLSLVVILYIGFLTTFTLLARDNFTARQMTVILIKVFFGSSYLGFEVASDISPILGWPLMLVFVCLTNILLITSLISLLSNSLAKVLEHAREEYLYIYSVYVLEASTSNRLTYYLPPLNLLALFLRPLKLLLAPTQLRRLRIVLLKLTHAPWVAALWLYESVEAHIHYTKTGDTSLSSSSLRGPASDTRLRTSAPQPLSTPALSATNQDINLPHQRPASKADAGFKNLDTPQHEDLKSLVIQLAAKVDELSAKVST